MGGLTRRRAIGLIGTTALAGCVAPAIVTREGDPFEGGIGGTGIVGTLTGFGSLLVNGLRVEMTGRTRVRTPFGRVSDSTLLVGMPLTIAARKTRDRLEAAEVLVSLPLVGTVRRSGGRLTVNGVPVHPETGAHAALVPGHRVAVSGTWTPAGVTATRADPAATEHDLIAGVAEAAGPTGLSLGGTPVVLTQGTAAPLAGQYASAFGRMTSAGFAASRLRIGRFGPRTGPLAQLSVEGYLEPIATAPGFRIAGLGHSFARDLNLAPVRDRRSVFFGPYDGTFRANKAFVVPEDFGRRNLLLSEGLGRDFRGPVLSVEIERGR